MPGFADFCSRVRQRTRHEVVRLAKHLPGYSTAGGPARGRHLSASEFLTHPSIEWHETYPQSRIEFCPLGLAPAEADELARRGRVDDWTNIVWPGYIARIKNGRYFGAPPTVLTLDDSLCSEWHWPHIERFGESDHPLQKKWHLDGSEKLRGNALIYHGYENIYHLLFEGIPRLIYLEKLGLKVDDVNWFIGPPPKNSAQSEVLRWFGIPVSRLHAVSGESGCTADSLIFTHTPFGIPRNLCHDLRTSLSRFASVAATRGRRLLYFVRGENSANRRVTNEADVIRYLTARGFETIHPHRMTLAEQSRVASEARCIVSAHGAALANLIWCGEGTTVIEMRRTEHFRGYWKLYWNIGSALNLNHRWLNCGGPPAGEAGFQYADLEVDLLALRKLLDATLE